MSYDHELQKLLLMLDLVPYSSGQGMEGNDTWEEQGENERSHSNLSEAYKPSFILTTVIRFLP